MFHYPRHLGIARASLRRVSTLVIAIAVTFASFVIFPSVAAANSATCAEGGGCLVGDVGPGGGVVFYISDGTVYEMDTYSELLSGRVGYGDNSTSVWCPGQDTTNVSTGTAIGTGAANTEAMDDVCGDGGPAQLITDTVRGEKSDWFLPSRDEMQALVDYLVAGQEPFGSSVGDVGLSNNQYWTSSQGSTTTLAWRNKQAAGAAGEQAKTGKLRWRAIRSFADPRPIDVVTRAIDSGAIVSFTPGPDGGSAVRNYEYSVDAGSNWEAVAPAVTSSPITISGLTNGTTYPVQIRPVYDAGPGVSSLAVDVIPVSSNTPPGAPSDLQVVPGSASLDLSWTAPADEGGAPISDYEFTTGSDEWKSLNTTDTTATITTDSSDPGVSLDNGEEYTIQIRAQNANGPSSASSSVSRTPGTPQAPAVSSETDWDQDSDTFTFSWNPPADNGDPVQFYQIVINQVTGRALVLRMSRFGSSTHTTTSTSFTATGVNTNYSYTFTITPYNSNGYGEPSVISIQATTPGGKPPRGLIQQFGLPAEGTCEEAASSSLNWAGVPSGGWGMSWAQWMHGGLGGAVCTRMLNYSNSQGGWVLAP